MTFELFQDVVLMTDAPDLGLRAGDIGTIVERHTASGKEEGFSVEFFDMAGRTIAVATLPASALRVPTAEDVPAVRLRKSA